jgi:hypothetical protein
MQMMVLCVLMNTAAYAQEKLTLYYDANDKGLDDKKKATYYFVVNYDKDGKPIGNTQSFTKAGKLLLSGTAMSIDKFDATKSKWKGEVLQYNEKGNVTLRANFDEMGNLEGIQTTYNEKGEKVEETEFTNGIRTKNYYLVYVKGEAVKYSYMNNQPLKLSTADRVIVPSKERKLIYQDGQPINYYFIDGISVAVRFTREQQYGDYITAYITIENGTDEQFDFIPDEMTFVYQKGSKVENGVVLNYADYMKKVNRRQAWSSAFKAFAEQQSANQAGYSAVSTSGYAVGSSGTTANANSTYGNATATTNTNTVVAGSTTTVGYSGSNQYAAQQTANANMQNYANRQYAIKKSISEGYLKRNTLFPSSRIIGYINLKFEKFDGAMLNIPINGKVYQF